MTVVLLVVSHIVSADCTSVIPQSVKLEPYTGAAISHDPFAPQLETLILSAEFDEHCETAPRARLFWKDSGTRSASNQPLKITQAGSLVFLSNSRFKIGNQLPANTRSIPFQQPGSGATATVTLQAGFQRRNRSTSAEKPGRTLLEILVVIETDTDQPLENSSQTVTLEIDTMAIGKLSLTDSIGHFDDPGGRELVGLGELKETGVEYQKNLWIWSNSSSVLEANSETNWFLLRTGDRSSEHSRIPFNIALIGQSGGDLLKNLNGNVFRSSTLSETTVDGSRYKLIVSVAEGASSSKRAGNYRGSITLTVMPRH